MRALTIRQPWADAIARGGKSVENRTWKRDWRGELLVHAGAQLDSQAVLPFRDPRVPLGGPDVYRGQRSAIIAVATLTEIHPAAGCCDPWGQQPDQDHPSLYHWTLADVRPLPEPVPATGRLGLWTPNGEVLDAVQRQLAEVAR